PARTLWKWLLRKATELCPDTEGKCTKREDSPVRCHPGPDYLKLPFSSGASSSHTDHIWTLKKGAQQTMKASTMTKVIFTVRIFALEMVLMLLTGDGSLLVAAAGAEDEDSAQVLRPFLSSLPACVFALRFL
ncbi:hypothetical protein LEMLEM_LOCUS23733, partial [Lemmus lemmus]